MGLRQSTTVLILVLCLTLASLPALGADRGESGAAGPWLTEAPPPLQPDTPGKLQPYGDELPLGSPRLPEEREVETIAEGVTHTQIERGEASGVYTVQLAFTEDHAQARQLRADLRDDGYRARVDSIDRSVPDDPDSDRPLGWVVRTGNADRDEDAQRLLDELVADGYSGSVVYTGESGFATTGPWSVNVLTIDPEEFDGTVEPVLAQGEIPGLATIPEMAEEHDALAAVNAGFFWVAGDDGVDGQLAGITMVDGELVTGQEQVSPNTEFVDHRSSLLLSPDADSPAAIDALGTDLSVTVDDETRAIAGLNRKPIDDELVHLTAAFGDDTAPAAETPPTDGVEVVIVDGAAIDVRERGGPIPQNGSVLVGVGEAATWLDDQVTAGDEVEVEHHVGTPDGEPLADDVTGVVNAGPRLVTDGQSDIRARADGFASSASFFHAWSVSRHPRTIGGVTEDDELLFITIDGRQAGDSVGASVWEAARVARSFGAENAVNLDGGGSTTMVVDDELLTGQPLRAVADGLIIQE
ncbi:phosphodiester glycosidase family protein [Egibacter rhizosphaerae]|nr:phosphodiester glycosidase family protein [Egibacter rhizosphaerae]